ncbi:MAG: divalent-cation tolerance protein CutA [Erythrobacter sp.]
MAAALVWCPFPDVESARAAADVLLDERMIACANILGSIESRFVWQGARSVGSEVGVLFKTTAEHLEDVIERLGELHLYETPAILGWQVDQSHPETLGWLSSSVST